MCSGEDNFIQVWKSVIFNTFTIFQILNNNLNLEKSRLSLAIQACEAATASISRPSSPLETAMQAIPEQELMVRAKMEDLLDQVHIFYFKNLF